MSIYAAYTDIDIFNSEAAYMQGYNSTSDYRRKRIDECRIFKDKARSLAAGLLLDYMADRLVSENSAENRREGSPVYISSRDLLAYVKDGLSPRECDDMEHGKPYFREYPDIHFSISHSEDYVLVAMSEGNIGADVQLIKERRVDIASRFFHHNEIQYLNCTDNEREGFFRIWTLKEAYIKYTGRGMSEGLNTFSVVDDNNEITGEIITGRDGIRHLSCIGGTLEDGYIYSIVSEEII